MTKMNGYQLGDTNKALQSSKFYLPLCMSKIIQKYPVTRFCLFSFSEKTKSPADHCLQGIPSTGLTRFELVNAGVKVLFWAFSPIFPHHC